MHKIFFVENKTYFMQNNVFYFYNLLINSKFKRQLNLNLNYKLMSITNSIATKLAIGVIAVAFFFGLMLSTAAPAQAALTTSQVDAIISLLQSFGADAATIANVQTSLTGGTPSTPSGGSTASVCPYTWSVSLDSGSSGADVMALQKFLNSDSATQIASSGVGSPGSETDYFGGLTKSAVAKFQDKYASEVLTPVGLSAGTGFFGSSSRAKANSLCAVASTPTTPTTPSTPATGTGLSVAGGSQPTATLAPDSAARVPFTNFIVTAGSDGDVVMDSVSIERTGLAPDAVFSGIVLLDSDGVQIGTSKTLNSNHQATVGAKTTIPAGTSKTFTIAGNMAADNSSRDGTIATLSVIAVNTSAAVSGSLPIAGTAQTINASLAIGSVTMGISSFDPNSAQSKEIGTTGVRIAGITVTAGSAEKVRINNIRWNQTGSAGSSDIANVVTVVDGTEYASTVSADGKFYTAKLGSGIVVNKGNLIDIYVKADIIGGSARTVIFDIDKTTDLNITGETFGYGITPPAGSDSAATTSSVFTAGTPWFDNATVTISAGSVTAIQKSSSVAAQNVAVNVSDQPLGAFETDIKGEAINVSGMALTIASTTGSGAGLLTNVTIVDQNGTVVAGPVDATYTSALVQTVTFTDSVTIPVGKMVYSVKGKLNSNIGNGGTYITTVTPSGWTSPVGDTTGDSITISTSAFTLNTMTVKAAALAVSVSATPVAQNITAGAQDFAYANYQFDATQSGEDVRFSSMVADLESSGTFAGDPSNLTSCQLFDGSTALNTGSNVVNPSTTATTSDDANTFTFDATLVVPKGTIKTLALKCDLANSIANKTVYQWGVRDTAANMTVTGVTSSNAVTETVTASNGQAMTLAAVAVVASKDSSSPSYAIASAGSTGVTAGVIKFRASNEAITLQRVGLSLTNTASSSSSDLVQVALYDGATKVGTAVFTGSNTRATSTLDIPVTLPKDADKTLTVKVDLANIGTAQAGSQGARIAVDIDTNSTNTQGVGQESGTTVNASGSTAFDGVRMFKTKPTFAKLAIPTTVLVTSTMDLYRFSVTADSAGSLGIYKFTVNLATSSSPVSASTTISNLKVKAYTNSSFSTEVSGFNPAGQLNDTTAEPVSGNNDILMTASTQGQDSLQIPAGSTYYFRVIGDVALTGAPTAGSITTNLQGDANYPIIESTPYLETAASSTSFTNAAGNDFIWSPNATTTSDVTHEDWTNGYFVSGLPSDNMDSAVIVK